MAYSAAIPSWLLQAGLVKETTWGTPVNPQTAFFPVKAPKMDIKYASIFDNGYRGNASMDFAYYQGTGSTSVDLPSMYFYPEATGNLLMAMLGADAVTGAGPYNHVFTLLNSGLRPSYTVGIFDGGAATSQQAAGCVFNSVSLKFANPGMLTVDAQAEGKIAITSATKSTATYDTSLPFLPWQAALTIATVANTKLVDLSLDIKSAVALNFGVNGSQDASNFVSDPVEVSGTMTFDSSDYSELTEYLSNTQPAVSILFTSGTNTLTLQMSKCAFIDPTALDHSKPNLTTTASFRAIANSTDAGTGDGPIKITLVNGQTLAY